MRHVHVLRLLRDRSKQLREVKRAKLMEKPMTRSVRANWTWGAKRSLLIQLIQRDIGARYKGSLLGVAWSLLTPLFLLLIYTYVFGAVFQAKWPSSVGTAGTPTLAEYAVILFAGLTTFNLFSDVVTRAPTLVSSNKNFVTKVVFPLEILPVVQLGAALFQYAISMLVLVVAVNVTTGYVSPKFFLLPIVLLPFCTLTLGLAWVFAGLGPYLRDINQVLATVVSGLMFVAPIFFARSVLPETLQQWTLLNPLTVPVEETRKILIYDQWPDFEVLGWYFAISLTVALAGWMVFGRVRSGFADVI